MQKIIYSVFLAGALTTTAIAQAPEIVGTYVNETGRTKVKLSECGAGVCGTVVWMKQPVNDVNNPDASKRDRPVVGIQAVSLKAVGDGTYAGTVYDTESGKTYSGKARFSGQSVELSGCVLGGLLCKGSTWRRE
ncbi:DUF2147 domain-containing protein [Phyllobacterium lublinensis]|uniref:DUF2147 domain-containing protein n=1 Tax=Phyllobacterium lublinensis TaxID=2875708 RepID=UPI001CCA1D35|nr:DUF2147 domain-containing protein [Phyllobacterium sp. 2063]MBZ9655753.1 DUF2147 domain-containing protein [Phyllobacterium sp. 2063]